MQKLLYTFSLFFILYSGFSNDTCTYDFYEQEGIVVIETESLPLANGWEFKSTFSDYSYHGYMEWLGYDYFGTPGEGLINIKIRISTPGVYTIQWRSKVGMGNSSTDYNDSWMRIPDAADFYGEKGSEIVHPHGNCTNDCPEGAGSEGWFKVFLSFTTHWTWLTLTSDNEGYGIRAKFDTVGVYTLQISGRSKHHCIDRIVLFHSSISESQAHDLSMGETLCGESPFDGNTSYLNKNQKRKITNIYFISSHELVITHEKVGSSFYLISSMGHILHKGIILSDFQHYDFSFCDSGIYFLKVGDHVQKLIKHS